MIEYIEDDVTKWSNYDFDIILANINRNVLLKILPNIKKTKGVIILSGLLANDEQILRKVCFQHNLNINKVNSKGEWISMELSIV